MLKTFIRYVSLNITGMLAIALCILIDTMLIARAMGADGLTALSLGVPIYYVINGIGHMLGVGGGSRYATYRAAGRPEKANQIFTIALLTGLIFSAISILIGIFFTNYLAHAFGARGHLFDMVADYIRTILTLGPALILSNTMAGFIRNDQAPRIAMVSTVILAVFNVILDYIFIFPLGLGMLGAALATMIGSTLGLIYLLWHWRSGKSNLKLSKFEAPVRNFCQLALTGMPTLIGDVAAAMVMTVFNLILLNLHGNLGVAVFGIIANLSFVVLSIFNGLGQGMQPLVSISYGKGDANGQKLVLKYSLLTVMALTALIYAFTFSFTDVLTGIFNGENDPLLRDMSRYGVRIYFVGFFFVGISIVNIIYLSVTSAPKAAFLLSLLRGGVIIVPLVLIFSYLWGMTGVWISYPVAEFLVMGIGALVFWRYKKI